jgi:hypothetical protein
MKFEMSIVMAMATSLSTYPHHLFKSAATQMNLSLLALLLPSGGTLRVQGRILRCALHGIIRLESIILCLHVLVLADSPEDSDEHESETLRLHSTSEIHSPGNHQWWKQFFA